MHNCRLEACRGIVWNAGYLDWGQPTRLFDCIVTDCDGGEGEYDALVIGAGETLVQDCQFENNQGSLVSGRNLECLNSSSVGNVLEREYPPHFKGLVKAEDLDTLPGSGSIEDCFFRENRAQVCVHFFYHLSLDLRRCSFAGNEGHGLAGSADYGLSIVGCSFVGNGGANGDGTGLLAPFAGINGKFSADPLFCGWLCGDLTLYEDSPCLPEHNDFGVLIGAHGLGCATGVEAAKPLRATLFHGAGPNPFNPKTTAPCP